MSLFKKKKDSSTSINEDEKKGKPSISEKDKPLASSVSKVSGKMSEKITTVSDPRKIRLSSNKDLFGSLLLHPVITEKAMMLGEENNCYVFEVSQRANKISVKKAIEEIYNFTPVKVKGKRVRYGHSQGRTKNKKRALVFLKKGDKIEFVKKA